VIFIGSLVLSIATTQSNPSWAYFGLHTRAWELALGAIIAVCWRDIERVPSYIRAIGGWVGLGLIVFAGFDFRRLALEELLKYNRTHLVKLAGELATDVEVGHYTKWGKPGIRAQLMDIRTRKLEMDFVLEGDESSFHVLNAVSPGWTCSIPFAEHVCDQIGRLLG
jgi:hypothetical protein